MSKVSVPIQNIYQNFANNVSQEHMIDQLLDIIKNLEKKVRDKQDMYDRVTVVDTDCLNAKKKLEDQLLALNKTLKDLQDNSIPTPYYQALIERYQKLQKEHEDFKTEVETGIKDMNHVMDSISNAMNELDADKKALEADKAVLKEAIIKMQSVLESIEKLQTVVKEYRAAHIKFESDKAVVEALNNIKAKLAGGAVNIDDAIDGAVEAAKLSEKNYTELKAEFDGINDEKARKQTEAKGAWDAALKLINYSKSANDKKAAITKANMQQKYKDALNYIAFLKNIDLTSKDIDKLYVQFKNKLLFLFKLAAPADVDKKWETRITSWKKLNPDRKRQEMDLDQVWNAFLSDAQKQKLLSDFNSTAASKIDMETYYFNVYKLKELEKNKATELAKVTSDLDKFNLIFPPINSAEIAAANDFNFIDQIDTKLKALTTSEGNIYTTDIASNPSKLAEYDKYIDMMKTAISAVRYGIKYPEKKVLPENTLVTDVLSSSIDETYVGLHNQLMDSIKNGAYDAIKCSLEKFAEKKVLSEQISKTDALSYVFGVPKGKTHVYALIKFYLFKLDPTQNMGNICELQFLDSLIVTGSTPQRIVDNVPHVIVSVKPGDGKCDALINDKLRKRYSQLNKYVDNVQVRFTEYTPFKQICTYLRSTTELPKIPILSDDTGNYTEYIELDIKRIILYLLQITYQIRYLSDSFDFIQYDASLESIYPFIDSNFNNTAQYYSYGFKGTYIYIPVSRIIPKLTKFTHVHIKGNENRAPRDKEREASSIRATTEMGLALTPAQQRFVTSMSHLLFEITQLSCKHDAGHYVNLYNWIGIYGTATIKGKTPADPPTVLRGDIVGIHKITGKFASVEPLTTLQNKLIEIYMQANGGKNDLLAAPVGSTVIPAINIV